MKWLNLRLRARRLARARRALADREHIAWSRALADASRALRAGPDGLLAVTDCRSLLTDEQRRQLRESINEQVDTARAVIEAARCKTCPPEVGPHIKGYCTHAQLEAYTTADVAAEVVGPLSYEEQSEMIGDPAADVLFRETGGTPWTEREQ